MKLIIMQIFDINSRSNYTLKKLNVLKDCGHCMACFHYAKMNHKHGMCKLWKQETCAIASCSLYKYKYAILKLI
jgi:hypothetical protein